MYPTRCYIMSLLSLSIASFFLLRSMENIAAIKIIKQTARQQAERITDHIVYLCVSEAHRILQHLDQDGERNARSDQDDRRLLRRHAKRTNDAFAHSLSEFVYSVILINRFFYRLRAAVSGSPLVLSRYLIDRSKEFDSNRLCADYHLAVRAERVVTDSKVIAIDKAFAHVEASVLDILVTVVDEVIIAFELD